MAYQNGATTDILSAKSMFSKSRYDIPPNSKIKVWTADGLLIYGTCLQNPKYCNDTHVVLQLVNCMVVDPMADKRTEKPLHKFFKDDIKTWKFMDKSPDPDHPANQVTEKLMSTHTIYTIEELKNFISVLKEAKIDLIGISLQGIQVSRDGSLGWICIITRQKTLVCIDAKNRTKEKNREFWQILDEEIFSNVNLLKIVHDCRPMVDFLFHQLDITVKNVFDTQCAELYIRSMSNMENMNNASKDREYNWATMSLSHCLKKFLSEVVMPVEVDQLEKFECEDFSVRSPLMERPFKLDIYAKSVAISMKYLLDLYDTLMGIFILDFKQCVQEQINFMVRGDMMDFQNQIVGNKKASEDVQRTIKNSYSQPFYSHMYNCMVSGLSPKKSESGDSGKSESGSSSSVRQHT